LAVWFRLLKDGLWGGLMMERDGENGGKEDDGRAYIEGIVDV
jgi:hypothetical protein